MAFSLETSGFGTQVPMATMGPLSTLKPISVNGGPLQLKPLAGWNVPQSINLPQVQGPGQLITPKVQVFDSHPEVVTEAYMKGMDGISKGIQAAQQAQIQGKKDAEAKAEKLREFNLQEADRKEKADEYSKLIENRLDAVGIKKTNKENQFVDSGTQPTVSASKSVSSKPNATPDDAYDNPLQNSTPPSNPFDSLTPLPKAPLEPLTVPPKNDRADSGQTGFTKAFATTFGRNYDGKIDKEDNGVGYMGDDTRNKDVMGVAINADDLIKQFGSTKAAYNQPVTETGPNGTVTGRILDVGSPPGRIDNTYAMNKAIGGNGMTPVQWKFGGPVPQSTPGASLASASLLNMNQFPSVPTLDTSRIPNALKSASLNGLPPSYSPPLGTQSIANFDAGVSKLGGTTQKELSAMDQQLANQPSFSSRNQDAPNPGPYKNEKNAASEALKSYDGFEPKGTVKWDNAAGGYIVERKPITQEIIESQANRKEMALGRKERNDRQADARTVSQLAREPVDFNKLPDVHNYTQQRGLRQMLVRLSPTYEAALKDPTHSKIPDEGMAQLMAQAESGGVAAISTIQGYLHSQGIFDTIEVLKSKAEGGNSGLSSPQRNQIYDLLVQESKAQGALANEAVTQAIKTHTGRTVDDISNYISPFILPKTKEEATQEIKTSLIPAMAKAKAARDKAEKSGDDAAFKRADDEWKKISGQARELNQKINTAQGHIVNAYEIENTPQGFLSPIPIEKLTPGALRRARASVSDAAAETENTAVDDAVYSGNQ